MADVTYRLAALDMDGTLLNTAHAITPRTKRTLARCAEAGKLIALTTGRCLSELTEYLETVPGIAYVIGENGACVYDPAKREMLFQIAMDDADVDYILEAARDLDVRLQVFIGNQSYMQAGDEATFERCHILDFLSVFRAGSVFVEDMEALCRESRGSVEKVNLYFVDAADKAVFSDRMAGRGVAVSDSIGLGCECSPLSATKAAGLHALCDALGLPIAQTLAIGDGGNDLDLMAAAGFSVAMGNAIEAVRALADAVTDDCDHDGCARALEKYLLGE